MKIGVSQVPEGRQVFKALTVADNLELGAPIVRVTVVEGEKVKR